MDPMKLRANLELSSMMIVALKEVTFQDQDNAKKLEDRLTSLLLEDYDNFNNNKNIIHEQDV